MERYRNASATRYKLKELKKKYIEYKSGFFSGSVPQELIIELIELAIQGQDQLTTEIAHQAQQEHIANTFEFKEEKQCKKCIYREYNPDISRNKKELNDLICEICRFNYDWGRKTSFKEAGLMEFTDAEEDLIRYKIVSRTKIIDEIIKNL
jgi:hypothetical protein